MLQGCLCHRRHRRGHLRLLRILTVFCAQGTGTPETRAGGPRLNLPAVQEGAAREGVAQRGATRARGWGCRWLGTRLSQELSPAAAGLKPAL